MSQLANGEGTAWHNFTFAFTPNTTTIATLKLETTVSGGEGVYLDNVSVLGTPAPEPGALVLLGTGLMALLAYAWRRRR